MSFTVYNPADEGEPCAFTFNGVQFTLRSNSDNELKCPPPDPDDETKTLPGFTKAMEPSFIGACLEQLRETGVVLLVGDEKADAALRQAAEDRHESYLRARYTPVLRRWTDRLKEFAAAGIEAPEEPSDVKQAKTRLKDWKLLVASVILALLAPFAQAQSGQFTFQRTLASATRTYCRTSGTNGDPFGGPIAGVGRLTTSGSSTTVNADNTSAFAQLPTPSATAGAVLFVSTDGGNTYTAYRVITKSDADTVVIHTAVNWASPGYVWSYFLEACGTTDADGWIPCGSNTNLSAAYVGGSSTATVTWEARGSSFAAVPIQIYPDNSAGAASRSFTAATVDNRTTFNLPSGVPFTACRIGFAGTDPIVSAWIDRSSK